MSGVRVKGLREVVRSLERLGVEAKDLKGAFKRIGALIQHDAQTLAPEKTGRLAASIRPSNTKNKSVIRAGGAKVPYAGVQHYGGYHNIEAKPFLTDAVSRNQSKAVDLMDEELNRLIRSLGLK
jgi:HK97 gp10 family phage protein